MRVQDYNADAAALAAEEFFRYAAVVPADKLSWSPLDGGRTVLSMCQELAMTPTWTMSAFGQAKHDWSEDAMAAQKTEMEKWTTVDQCKEQFKSRFSEVDKFFRGLTDEQLKETRWLPYNGGRDHTFLEMMDYPRWNATYHSGQVAYIQTLYGDKEMH